MKQAIVWLKTPIKNQFGDASILLATVGQLNDRHLMAVMNDDAVLTTEYDSVITADDVTNLAAFVLGDISGVSDIRKTD